MNSITSRLSASAGILIFPLYFIWRKRKKNVMLLLMVFALTISSCFQSYFRTNTQTKVNTDILQRLQSYSKVFIIHFKNGVAELNNMKVKNDVIEADLSEVSQEHLQYLDPKTDKKNQVKNDYKAVVLAEVHLYTEEKKNETGGFMLPLASINRIDVYELDKNATDANHVLSVVGLITGGVVIIGALLVAITCNCPQVYINNNGQYHFNGGMYSGAVYSSLERTDYMPLSGLRPTDDLLSLKIGNAPNEEQFINSIQLLTINHSMNTKVLVDRHGTILSFKEPESPIEAISNTVTEVKESLLRADQNYYQFNNTPGNNDFSNVILSFKKPAGKGKAKLIINGKNSAWSGFIYKEFNGLFGAGMNKWAKKEDSQDPRVMEQWQKDQALPMMVYIQKNGNWEFADYFSLVGNTASRDAIMELDLSDIKEETINIKLETVYRFWDLDYAALDFSQNEIKTSAYSTPVKADKTDATIEKNNLLTNDKQYTHLEGNEAVNLEFEKPLINKNIATTYFLVSRGYYHNLKQYTGKTKKMELLQFKNKGAFNAFSKSKYNVVNNELAKYTVKK